MRHGSRPGARVVDVTFIFIIAVGISSHALVHRVWGPGSHARRLLVSTGAAAIASHGIMYFHYLRHGITPDPPIGAVCLAVTSFGMCIACGLPFPVKPTPRPGVCARCGYDLTGNVSGVCPECGHGVDQPW